MEWLGNLLPHPVTLFAIFAALVIVVNFLVDLAYVWLDPRLRQRA